MEKSQGEQINFEYVSIFRTDQEFINYYVDGVGQVKQSDFFKKNNSRKNGIEFVS